MSMFVSSPKLVTSWIPGASMPPVDDYDAFPVTPSDSVDLPSGVIPGAGTRPTQALQVTGSGGNINVQLYGGGTAVLTGLAAGQILQIQVTRVLSTSTTATGILALY